MIICKRPAPPDDHLQKASLSVSGWSFARGQPLRMIICNHEKDMKNAFLKPFTMRWISMKKRIKIFTFAKVRAEAAPPPYGQQDRKIFVLFWQPRPKEIQKVIYPDLRPLSTTTTSPSYWKWLQFSGFDQHVMMHIILTGSPRHQISIWMSGMMMITMMISNTSRRHQDGCLGKLHSHLPNVN